MASQVAHIVYANRFLDKLKQDDTFHGLFDSEIVRKITLHKDEFILGNIFPDIRTVIMDVSRKDTHMFFPEVNLDFSGLTAFQAGWKFHVFCDMKREEILNSHRFYEIIDGVEKSWLANKMLEDKLIYGCYDNWEKLVYYFNNIPKRDWMKGVLQSDAEFWYALVAKYIEKQPDEKEIHAFISKTKQPDIQKADMVLEKIKEISKFDLAKSILEKVYNEIV